jgi:hypothetical protein
MEIDFSVLKAGISPEMVPMTELPTIIQEVNSNLLRYVVGSLNPEHKYFICFDQLDLGFNPADPEYSNRLIGLLLACRDLNVSARQSGVKLLVGVFLRDDIYSDLQFEDKNKITENYLVRIEWDTPRTTKTLKGLMEKRFTRLLGERPGENISWEQVFDEMHEMTGHQTKYQHILDRTFLRPRDIIKFCNEVLSRHKLRLSIDTVSDRFENLDLNQAKDEYSNYLLNELDDEIHKHIPEYKQFLEIFKAIGVLQFSKQEFLKAFEQKKNTLPPMQDPLIVLKRLYEFSVVGFYAAGGKGYGGSEYVYKYKDPRAQFNEHSANFRLHPGLMEVLGLKKYVKSPGKNEI